MIGRILVFVVVVGISNLCQAAPAYTNGQWYVWEATNAVIATNAMNYINNSMGCFPITGKHPVTGAEKAGTAQTDKYVETVCVRKDGKVCFERMTAEFCTLMGITEAQKDTFMATYSPQIEIYAEEWFNE
jgi:hypothetical protein